MRRYQKKKEESDEVELKQNIRLSDLKNYKNLKPIKLFILLVLIPLCIGAFVYYLCCPDVLFVKCLDRYTGIGFHFPQEVSRNVVLVFFRNYILDLLWAFSMTCMICIILWKSRFYRFAFSIPLITGILLEFFQKEHVLSGTFDYYDIMFEFVGVVIALVVCEILRRNKQ